MNKPCPFCGGLYSHVATGSTYRWVVVECDNCCARGPEARAKTYPGIPADNADAAYLEWNTRVEQNETT